jgi:hypothetical protein
VYDGVMSAEVLCPKPIGLCLSMLHTKIKSRAFQKKKSYQRGILRCRLLLCRTTSCARTASVLETCPAVAAQCRLAKPSRVTYCTGSCAVRGRQFVLTLCSPKGNLGGLGGIRRHQVYVISTSNRICPRTVLRFSLVDAGAARSSSCYGSMGNPLWASGRAVGRNWGVACVKFFVGGKA